LVPRGSIVEVAAMTRVYVRVRIAMTCPNVSMLPPRCTFSNTAMEWRAPDHVWSTDEIADDDLLQDREGNGPCLPVVLTCTHHPAETVGGDDLGVVEGLLRPTCSFQSPTGRQDDQARGGHTKLIRVFQWFDR
jgi:hypothetical protein